MSKLYDQLKYAARTRERAAASSAPHAGGLLARALQRAESERDDREAAQALDASQARAAARRAKAQAEETARQPARALRKPMSLLVALVAATVIGTVALWQFTPPRGVVSPTLKLDYELDLTRMDASARSSRPGPALSR